MFVGLVLNRVEHHRYNARVVNEQRNRSMRSTRIQVREQVHQPLGFFRSASQRGILGVVGAGSYEGMQFAEPRQDGTSVEEHVSNCTLGGIRAVCVGGIGVAITPCAANMVFSKQDCPETPDPQSCTEYRKLVALANFISNWTRPDITFTVNKLCKFMSNPGPVHWAALKHLLRYLKGTVHLGLCYDFGKVPKVQGLHGYTDASYADCPDTSKSTVAYVFFYGGAILSWFSKLHTFVTTCTNHSEYAALASGAK